MSTYFPYSTPRESQIQILNTIEQSTTPIIIDAATGSGKTAATLSGLLEKRENNEKILIFVRTINQMNPILREWAGIRAKTGEDLTILPLLGRSRICNDKQSKTKKTMISCDLKAGTKRKKKLEKLRNRNKRDRLLKWIGRKLVKLPGINNFTTIMYSRENCAYYNTWSIIQSADIIVATYGYFKQLDRIERESETSIENMHIIIDEAHNFARERVYTLKKHHLRLFMKLFYRDEFLKKTHDEIRGMRIIGWQDIESNPDKLKQSIRTVLNKIEQSIRLLRSKSDKLKHLPAELLNSDVLEIILLEIRKIFSNYSTGTLIVSQDSINIVDMDPFRIFERLSTARSLILQSGTFTLIEGYRKLYGLPDESKIIDLMERDIRKLRKNENVFKAFYTSSLTSTSRFRNDDLYKRYVHVIEEIFSRSKSHLLVLGPSYEFINQLAKHISCKMVMERSNTRVSAMHNYIIKSREKLIILGNQNGKIMEGNEWTVDGRSVVNTVILTGLATRVPREIDEIILNHRKRILQDDYLASLFLRQIPLSVIGNQAFGRTRRHRLDRGAVIILDDRVDEFLQRSMWLSRYTELEDLLEEYEIFQEKIHANPL